MPPSPSPFLSLQFYATVSVLLPLTQTLCHHLRPNESHRADRPRLYGFDWPASQVLPATVLARREEIMSCRLAFSNCRLPFVWSKLSNIRFDQYILLSSMVNLPERSFVPFSFSREVRFFSLTTFWLLLAVFSGNLAAFGCFFWVTTIFGDAHPHP